MLFNMLSFYQKDIIQSKVYVICIKDDKAMIKIGVTASNKQSPKRNDNRVKLTDTDTDWTIVSKHSLTLFSYASISISKNMNGFPESVLFSGPTYIAIRRIQFL